MIEVWLHINYKLVAVLQICHYAMHYLINMVTFEGKTGSQLTSGKEVMNHKTEGGSYE